MRDESQISVCVVQGNRFDITTLPLASAVLHPLLSQSNQAPCPCLPPYIRCVLNGQVSEATVPAGFGGRLSQQDWLRFWTEAVDRTPAFGTALVLHFLLYFMIWIYLILTFDVNNLGFHPLAALTIDFVLGCTVLLVYWHFVGLIRKGQLEGIRSFCKVEEVRLFRSLGFFVECEFEWSNDGSRYGYCIYFHPIPIRDDADRPDTPVVTHHFNGQAEYRNGYKRIQLFNDGACVGRTWSPISYSHSLVMDGSFPDVIDTSMWAHFWSDMHAVSRHVLFAYRLKFAATRALALFVMTVLIWPFKVTLSEDTVVTMVIVLIGFYMYTWLKLSTSTRQVHRTVDLYRAALQEESGIAIVIRNVYGAEDVRGLYHIQYLYVYDLRALDHLPVAVAALRDVMYESVA